jgi:hypothetical protein
LHHRQGGIVPATPRPVNSDQAGQSDPRDVAWAFSLDYNARVGQGACLREHWHLVGGGWIIAAH